MLMIDLLLYNGVSYVAHGTETCYDTEKEGYLKVNQWLAERNLPCLLEWKLDCFAGSMEKLTKQIYSCKTCYGFNLTVSVYKMEILDPESYSFI